MEEEEPYFMIFLVRLSCYKITLQTILRNNGTIIQDHYLALYKLKKI